MDTIRTILIVEDEAVVALDLKNQLEDLGYKVIGTADCGERALSLARTHKPSLILMDVMLKGDMDGIDIAAELRRTQDTPVIFLTSYSDVETVQRAARTAPYGYLTKPFQVKELAAGIEVAMHKSRMERQLRESERWFASTLRCVQDGVIVTESDAKVRFLNRAAEELTGWSLEEASGRSVDEIVRFKSESANIAMQAMDESRVVGIERAKYLKARQGGWVPVDESAAPVLDEDGQRLGAVLVLRDVRERLNQEERLRSSEERFRNAFDFAPLGMALISMDGRFIQVNAALCNLLGYDAATLRQLGYQLITHEADRAHEAERLHELFVDQQGISAEETVGHSIMPFEKRYLRRDGHVVPTLVSVSMLREEGEPVCYLYQIHDMTAQKEAAENLAKLAAERLDHEAKEMASQAKSEFLSRMSHEMRTPLNAVIGFAQLLQTRPHTEHNSVTAYSEHILAAGRHLLALVDDVLDLQRVADGRLKLNIKPIPLNACLDVVEQFLLPTALSRQIQFERQTPGDVSVLADAIRLRQILLNVGSNAVKYNRPGGTITWQVQLIEPARVAIIVTDNGDGMTEEQLGRLFQPFERLGRETTSTPGSGLGLVITRRLAEEMGGSITVRSVLNEGTSVRVELPRALAQHEVTT